MMFMSKFYTNILGMDTVPPVIVVRAHLSKIILPYMSGTKHI